MNLDSNHKLTRTLVTVALCLAPLVTSVATVLDDFNAAQRTGWTDADPAHAGLPGGQQANGVFTFNLPTLGQPMFVSSTKTSPTFELKEGRTIEFRIDMVSGRGGDSFAVLGFMPGDPNSLAGYGIAKSETDVLITKGINKYFIDDSSAPVKNNNVTLVLNLSVKGGSVYITGQVLDKDDRDKVIWEKTFIDTPAADILATGTDDPPGPFITTGKFVLYLYADGGTDPAGYQVVLDNASYFITDSSVLDDFNAAQRTAWQDADPAHAGLPGGQQANGVFTFNLPMLGQPMFVSSTKTSKTFSLDEGTRHEFSVDLVSAQSADAYAVLAFIPAATGANSLAGYGIAKSETDVVITKGINKYFIDYDTAPVKNTNVKLVLTLTVVNGNVTIRGRVLDKDNNDQVLWDQTFVDTPAADVFGTGTDDPPAPFVGLTGNAVLYLYADGGTDPGGYQVVFDNLIAAEPPATGNTPPIISEVSPAQGTAFLASPATLSFKVQDDKPLPDTGISVSINGFEYTSTNGLVLSGQTTNRTVTLSSGTGPNTNYIARLVVIDSDGVGATNILYFDTFTADDRIIEVEDYNFGGGKYFNNPVPGQEQVPADNCYVEQVGTEGIDFHDVNNPNLRDRPYRSQDPVTMQHTLDQPRAKYDPNISVYGYDVGEISADEWLNYTREFTAGNYEVYLREAVVNFLQADSTLELVTSDATQPNQTVSSLGSFLGKTSGFTFRNVPLTDGSGLNKIVVSLSGKTTLRLHQITGDTSSSARYQNYLIFVPVVGAGTQRAIVTSIQPAPDSIVRSVNPVIEVSIQNRDTSVNTSTIKLEINGAQVTPTVVSTATGATVTYALDPLPPPNSTVLARISFKDNQDIEVSTPWQFIMGYNNLDPALCIVGTGKDRGFNVRVVQAQTGQNNDNSLNFAEALLRPGTTFLIQYETNVVAQVINYSQNGPGSADGNFPDDELIPGLDPSYSTDDIAMEITTYLDLPVGKYRFGATCDDSYGVQVVPNFSARSTPYLAAHNGPANETYDFVVSQSGLYRFRMVWCERGGAAYVEWFQSNFTDGARALLNTNATGIVKAYTTVNAPAQFTQFSIQNGQLTMSWSGGGVLEESTDLKNWTPVSGAPAGTYTIAVGTAAGAKFYRTKQ